MTKEQRTYSGEITVSLIHGAQRTRQPATHKRRKLDQSRTLYTKLI